MSCYRPVLVRLRDGDVKHMMPCGRCVGCDLERSRQWAVRCMHEASTHQDNCFVTLTYDDAHLPPHGSLDRSAFPKFIKRLRSSQRFRAMGPKGRLRTYYPSIRYFHCGEYGDRYGRPHYHACLFGFDFPDKQFVTMRGEHRVFKSELLGRLWTFGHSEIGSVTFESAAYIARYIMKKVRGANDEAARKYLVVDEDGAYTEKEREYATMSRRPGIGKAWFRKYVSDVYPHDVLISRGEQMRPPRYYDKLLAEANPDMYAEVQLDRVRKEVDYGELIASRLAAKEAVTKARLNLKKRSLD